MTHRYIRFLHTKSVDIQYVSKRRHIYCFSLSLVSDMTCFSSDYWGKQSHIIYRGNKLAIYKLPLGNTWIFCSRNLLAFCITNMLAFCIKYLASPQSPIFWKSLDTRWHLPPRCGIHPCVIRTSSNHGFIVCLKRDGGTITQTHPLTSVRDRLERGKGHVVGFRFTNPNRHPAFYWMPRLSMRGKKKHFLWPMFNSVPSSRPLAVHDAHIAS